MGGCTFFDLIMFNDLMLIDHLIIWTLKHPSSAVMTVESHVVKQDINTAKLFPFENRIKGPKKLQPSI